MAKKQIRALTKSHKSPENDPIPALYKQAQILTRIAGDLVNDGKAGHLSDQALSIERTILTTPATSLEGATRQLQLLASLLDNGGSFENIGLHQPLLFRALWLALFGTLTHLLPQFEVVPHEQNYDLLTTPGGQEQAFGMFKRVANETLYSRTTFKPMHGGAK